MARQVAETSAGNPFFAEEIAHSLAAGGRGGRAGFRTRSRRRSLRALTAYPARRRRSCNTPRSSATDSALGPSRSCSMPSPRRSSGPWPRDPSCTTDPPRKGLFTFHHQLIRDVAYDSLPRADPHQAARTRRRGDRPRVRQAPPGLAEVIAFHLMQAAELAPGPVRGAAAFEAARSASTYAARRAAAPRAQELLAQAAGIAPTAGDRIRALSDAAHIAMSRARGDEAYLLLREAGEVAETGGARRSGGREVRACGRGSYPLGWDQRLHE